MTTEPDSDERTRLERFFEARTGGLPVRLVGYEPISGGYSRETVKVWVENDHGRHGYVIRSDPRTDNSVLHSDRAEEWALLTCLAEHGAVPIPRPLWFDDGTELGTPSIVSELVDGPSLLSVVRGQDPRAQLSAALPIADVLATIHGVDLDVLPRHLAAPATWHDHIAARIERWRAEERVHVEPEPVFRLIACWLEANIPDPVPLSLTHGDFHPANLIVHPDGDYRVIDWELASVGDPREDLGWMALAAIAQPPDVVAADPAAFYERYRVATGLPVDALGPEILAYFVVLSATTCFLEVVGRLRELAEGRTTAINVAYVTNIKTGLERVLYDAMNDPKRVTGMAS